MASPDEAERAAEEILRPAKDELAAKQEKVSRRKARNAAVHRLLTPASSAFAALALAEYFTSDGLVVLAASAIGLTVGLILERTR